MLCHPEPAYCSAGLALRCRAREGEAAKVALHIAACCTVLLADALGECRARVLYLFRLVVMPAARHAGSHEVARTTDLVRLDARGGHGVAGARACGDGPTPDCAACGVLGVGVE